ncbi:MAG: vitamin B12 dependent-methionine synthase activation domain-containing protein [Melioribacteraceae bacterium]
MIHIFDFVDLLVKANYVKNNSSSEVELFEFTPERKELNINLDRITETIGYSKSNIPDLFRDELIKLFSQSIKIVKPKCSFLFISSAQSIHENSELIIDNVTFSLDRIIFSHLKNISSAVLFVGTVGAEFDDWIDIIKQDGDPLKEYVSNLLGSAIAESIAEWTNQKIVEYIEEQNLKCSNRYSPGYCGWSVSEQHKLFSFFPKNICGIELLDSGLMLPIKSVSGIVGVGKNLERMDYPCDVCNVPHCYKNRIVSN